MNKFLKIQNITTTNLESEESRYLREENLSQRQLT